MDFFNFVRALVEGTLALIDGLFTLFKSFHSAIQFGAPAIQALHFTVEFISALIQVGFGRLNDFQGAITGIQFDLGSPFSCFLNDILGRSG